jgi:hypothetical protein
MQAEILTLPSIPEFARATAELAEQIQLELSKSDPPKGAVAILIRASGDPDAT